VLKRGLVSYDRPASNFTWQGSSLEAMVFRANDVSERLQRRSKAGASLGLDEPPFYAKPTRARNSGNHLARSPDPSIQDLKPAGIPTDSQPHILLGDFSEPARILLQSLPDLGYMHIDMGDFTSGSLFGSEPVKVPISNFERPQLAGALLPKSKLALFDLLD
ncbi:hypothetical protein L0F63_001548, partial [Massospora cicadina]